MAVSPGSTPEKAVQPAENSPRPARPSRKRKPNYAQIHSKPLPLEIHPLPAFHPTHPISLLKLAYVWISHIFSPPSSHLPEGQSYLGYFSPETRSVHVTYPAHVRALWEMGFFGKGTLSRSEPSWLEREKARSLEGQDGGAEGATAKRREERRMFKLERARAERERVERQRREESGELGVEEMEEGKAEVAEDESGVNCSLGNGHVKEGTSSNERTIDSTSSFSPEPAPRLDDEGSTINDATISFEELILQDQEHLQLTLEEAFFLHYALGVLTILPHPPSSPPTTHEQKITSSDLLDLFTHTSTFPPPAVIPSHPSPDDQFLLNYITYHHYRSLGWTVRPGLKFGVDYLLYNRGPVFSHAEFGVIILPSYSHRYWNTPGGRGQRRVQEQRDWWWLHGVNRVQGQVKKTLVVCFVEVPSPFEVCWEGGVGGVVGCYGVREFVVRRWVPNRSRD